MIVIGSLKTIKEYSRQRGAKVEVVIMDMSPVFKSAVQKALGSPVVVADSLSLLSVHLLGVRSRI
ncbi:transposase [Alkalihalobacillus deserti]|uniref:transposase n=1 Tax=Alkalihalobacillus deserti TaxID=2879466 RepID=UPI00355903B4